MIKFSISFCGELPHRQGIFSPISFQGVKESYARDSGVSSIVILNKIRGRFKAVGSQVPLATC